MTTACETTRLPPTLRQELPGALSGLRARALRLCGDEAQAMDLVQDTVERALRFEHGYERGTNVRAWLNQVLFSVFITGCRRRQRDRRALELLAGDPNAWTRPEPREVLPSLTPSTERHLDALPEQYASAVRLVDVDGFSYKEAAESLGVPVGTVMSRLFRGRRQLAERLDGGSRSEPAHAPATRPDSVAAPAPSESLAA